MKRLKIPQKLVYKKLYVHEIAAVNLSKIYFLLKNPKKTCKPNNRDLNRDWIKKMSCDFFFTSIHQKIILEMILSGTLLLYLKIVQWVSHTRYLFIEPTIQWRPWKHLSEMSEKSSTSTAETFLRSNSGNSGSLLTTFDFTV